MIKSILHISFSILLLLANAGIIISKHYCHGTLVSTVVNDEAEFCCTMGDCCHNETTFYQVDDDFAASQITELPSQIEIDLFGIELNKILLTEVREYDIFFDLVNESPPPKTVLLKLAEVQSYRL